MGMEILDGFVKQSVEFADKTLKSLDDKDSDEFNLAWATLAMGKLADLVVRECAKVVQKSDPALAVKLREHFWGQE